MGPWEEERQLWPGAGSRAFSIGGFEHGLWGSIRPRTKRFGVFEPGCRPDPRGWHFRADLSHGFPAACRILSSVPGAPLLKEGLPVGFPPAPSASWVSWENKQQQRSVRTEQKTIPSERKHRRDSRATLARCQALDRARQEHPEGAHPRGARLGGARPMARLPNDCWVPKSCKLKDGE